MRSKMPNLAILVGFFIYTTIACAHGPTAPQTTYPSLLTVDAQYGLASYPASSHGVTLEATVLNTNGDPVPAGMHVSFTSSDPDFHFVTPSNPVTDARGVARVSLIRNNVPIVVTVKADRLTAVFTVPAFEDFVTY